VNIQKIELYAKDISENQKFFHQLNQQVIAIMNNLTVEIIDYFLNPTLLLYNYAQPRTNFRAL
jgi:hypothetical protein